MAACLAVHVTSFLPTPQLASVRGSRIGITPSPIHRSETQRAGGLPRSRTSLHVRANFGSFFQQLSGSAKRAMAAAPWKAADYFTTERWWNEGTVAVVTGSNKGIGAEVARQLAAQGLTPVVTGRTVESAKASAASIGSDVGREIPYHQLDVQDPASVARFAEFVRQRFGGVDIIVNNAAIAYKGSTFGLQETKTTLDTNLYGVKRVTDALLPLLRPKGRVIFVGSSAGKLARFSPQIQQRAQQCRSFADVDALAQDFVQGVERGDYGARGWPQTMYGVSKLTLACYARLLAEELSGKGCLVSVCHPGYVSTDMSSWRGELPASEGADTPTWLALAPESAVPTGKFWYLRKDWGY